MKTTIVASHKVGITCNVLVDPITSLLLPAVGNDVMASCRSGGFRHSSDKTQEAEIARQKRKTLQYLIQMDKIEEGTQRQPT